MPIYRIGKNVWGHHFALSDVVVLMKYETKSSSDWSLLWPRSKRMNLLPVLTPWRAWFPVRLSSFVFIIPELFIHWNMKNWRKRGQESSPLKSAPLRIRLVQRDSILAWSYVWRTKKHSKALRNILDICGMCHLRGIPVQSVFWQHCFGLDCITCEKKCAKIVLHTIWSSKNR